MNYQDSPFYQADRTSTRGRNTCRAGEENCTVWYHPQTGDVRGVGPSNPSRGEGLQSICLKCDDLGVLPELFGSRKEQLHNQVVSIVLEQAKAYRSILEQITTAE